MHQSIILIAPPSANIDSFLDKYTPKHRQIYLIEQHLKEKGKTVGIFIEDIDSIKDSVKTSGPGAAARVFVIRDAALMNVRSQNAFLKHLEEPSSSTYFILVTQTPQLLLETIRSRCVRFELPTNNASSADPQINFISKGDSAEIEKLTKNKSYLKKRTEVYTQAKILIGGSNFDKLKLITSISGDRVVVLEIISASLHIIQVQIKSRYNPSLIVQANRLSIAYDRIIVNGNVRLQLVDCVI